MAQSLAQQAAAAIPDVGLRVGTVASFDAAGIMVSINGSIEGPFGALAGYFPIVGDTVSMVRQDSAWLILGRVSLTPGSWTGLTLLNGWTNRGASWAPLSYRRVAGGVEITGEIVPGTTVDGTIIATLPSEFSALHQQLLPARTGVAASKVCWLSLDTVNLRIFDGNGIGLALLQIHPSVLPLDI